MWCDGIKGIKSYQVGDVWYHYDRKSGKKLEAQRGTPAFKKEIERIRGKPKADDFYGTIDGAILLYDQDDRWKFLRDSTKADYRKVLTWLETVGSTALIDVTKPFAVELRNKTAEEKGYRFANKTLTILKLLMDCAEEAGWISEHRIKGIPYAKRPQELPQRNKPWTAAECRAMLDNASPTVLVPLALCIYLGFRIGDALTISAKDYDGLSIRKETNKRGVFVSIPVPAPLKTILDNRQTGDSVTLALKADGTPWAYGGYHQRFNELRAKLAAPTEKREALVRKDITLHGCRHTVATILRDAGYSAGQVAQYLGQDDETMPLHYGKSAELNAVTGPMAQIIALKVG
jgi:integrase